MKPRDILKLAPQILGLVFLYQGLLALPGGLAQLWRSIPSLNFDDIFTTFAVVGWPLLISYWLLRRAPLLMGIAYPDPSTRADQRNRLGEHLEKKQMRKPTLARTSRFWLLWVPTPMAAGQAAHPPRWTPKTDCTFNLRMKI